MKKTIYIILTLTMLPLIIKAQADLEVDRNGFIQNTLVIGKSLFSNNNEIEINDITSDGSSLMLIDDGIREAVIGIDNTLEGITGTISPHPLTITTGNDIGLRMNSFGNVGLGTAVPGTAFHISEDGTAGVPTDIAILESSTSKKPAILFSENGIGAANTMGILYDGSGIGTAEKMQIINDASNPFVTWTNNGWMGIGTSNPRDKLDVICNIAISSNPGSFLIDNGSGGEAALTYDGIDLSLTSSPGIVNISADRRVILQSQGGSVILDAENDIEFKIDGFVLMHCLKNGNWGLNTSTPGARFHIRQNTSNLPALRIENDNNTNMWDWELDITVLTLGFNGTNKGFYDTSGNYQLFSDRRLKSDITVMDDGVLQSILKLKPSSYYYKRDVKSEHKTIGFIAQEMKEEFPKLVVENDDEDSDLLGIKYSLISVYAVKAIQEQNKEIKNLKSNLASQNIDEQQLGDLAAELANIEKRINAIK